MPLALEEHRPLATTPSPGPSCLRGNRHIMRNDPDDNSTGAGRPLTMPESLRAYSAFRIRSFRIRRLTLDVTAGGKLTHAGQRAEIITLMEVTIFDLHAQLKVVFDPIRNSCPADEAAVHRVQGRGGRPRYEVGKGG